MCATDLCSRSDQAIRRALDLGDMLDAEVMLLHVVSGNLPLRLAGRRAARARDALAWYVRRHSRVRSAPEISVRIGSYRRTIVRAAKEWGADIVVLGTQRRRRADRLLWSTVERVAHLVRKPVLAVTTDSGRRYGGVTFLSRRHLGLSVRVADELDLFDSAHVTVVPYRALHYRALHWLGERLRSRNESLASKLRAALHRRDRKTLELAGLHLMGFEIAGGLSTRALLARIKQARGSQLLVAGTDLLSTTLRGFPTKAIVWALRHRACDVLIVPASHARASFGDVSFAAARAARERSMIVS